MFHAAPIDKVMDRLYIGDLQGASDAKRLKAYVKIMLCN